jgi:hypothetical protein
MAKKGVPRQMFATTMAVIAHAPSPSQLIPRSASPLRTIAQLKTLKVESKSQSQAIADRAVGTIHGSSSAARATFFNRNDWFMSTARPMPNASFSVTVTPVYTSVFRTV